MVLPAVTTFAISRLQVVCLCNRRLNRTTIYVVGDWNFGSAVSIFMMIIILISMAVTRFEDESDRKAVGYYFKVKKYI